jgi:hypothetical protein
MTAKKQVSWAKRQRFAFIERRLAKTGRLNRKDIMNKFSVSAPQSSADIDAFCKLYPGRMKYDRSRKAFIASTTPQIGRNTTAAAHSLMYASDEWLEEICHRDPGMIRDVAAALIYERAP